MNRYIGGEQVPGGFYWSSKKWDVVTVPGQSGTLEGNRTDRYIKIPFMVMIPVAVVVSFAFVIFLPFIGFALFLRTLVRGGIKAVVKLAGGTAVAVAPGWQPGEAHLTGRPEDAAKLEGAPQPEAKLAALKAEVDAQRREEK